MSSENELRDIVTYLKDQRAAANDKSPLPRPGILDDDSGTVNEEKRAIAEEIYVKALLLRPSLTLQETQYLGTTISKHLREVKG